MYRLCLLLTLLVLSGCATVPENTPRSESFVLTDTHDTVLGRQFSSLRMEHPDQSGFLLLGRGIDAFLARALLAQSAERSIDAQYYLLHDDLTGQLFIDQLLSAADRGVRVRLLVDDMDLEGRDFSARALDAHPHVEVRIFNPFSRDGSRALQLLTRFGSVTRRMHNKSFTVDNQVTILGGRNIGDEYFEADPALMFNDLDVLAIGDVAAQVSTSFDHYWNHPLAYPVAVLQPNQPDVAELLAMRRQLSAFVATQQEGPYLRALREAPLAQRLRSGDLALS
jgi:putative cardiolipin synthase